LDKSLGRNAFFQALRDNMKDGETDLAELRMAFSSQKELLDYMFDQATDLNLLVGLPQQGSGESSVALRNTGGIDATVNLRAVTSTGENLTTQATVRSKSFGEVSFKSAAKISRVEIDPEKYYPQTEYSDDIAPKEFAEGDRLLAVKRLFDKQDFAGAETAARTVLRDTPRFDDVRVLLGRALLALGRAADAEKEFTSVLNEKLPTGRSLAWANVGLGESAAKTGQNAQAAKFAEAAIAADADYGASLAARTLRKRLNIAGTVPDDVKTYFARFDKAAVSNRKAEVDTLVVPGEVGKFAGGISGSTEQWQTQVLYADRLDANTILAETTVSLKLLNRDPESGPAVFRLTRVGDAWKLSGVDMFEVR
jgi:tetratricopeptide (TPR) repeat protein